MAIPASTTIALHNQTLSKAAPGTLLDALQRRRTAREFSPEELNDRHLSQLLWAAYGINRIDGRRTAPAAMGIYALRIYAILPDGIYSYRPEGNELIEILAGDFRGFSGKQDFVADAPLNIVIYADYKAFRTGDPKVDEVLSGHGAAWQRSTPELLLKTYTYTVHRKASTWWNVCCLTTTHFAG